MRLEGGKIRWDKKGKGEVKEGIVGTACVRALRQERPSSNRGTKSREV